MKRLFLILVTLLMCGMSLMAQKTYQGSVVDGSDNEPLVGVTIMPVGGGQGTVTDLDGKFAITVPDNVTAVRVSYIGYKESTVALHDDMVVRLMSTTSDLDEVVVVAYGTANKESLTGSVAQVGSKEIESRPVTTVTTALEGSAPGVQVNNSTGTPGSSPEIRIRGFSSINGVNNPLYVVDGFPYEGSIADLNPNDIESMSVLKDAASCALYGNRGANGVILITTKRAKTGGKVDVTFQIRQGFNNRELPFYDRLGANEWMQAQFDSQVNGYLRYYTCNAPQYGYDRDFFVQYNRRNFMKDFAQNNIYGAGDTELFNEQGKFVGGNPLPGYTDLDWWKAISNKTGYRQEYNVNASGSTEKFSVFASIGYLKDKGYVIGTDFDRFTGRLNATFQPVKFLKVGINLAATQQESMTGNVQDDNLDSVNNPFLAETFAPIYPYYVHDAEGNIVVDDKGQPMWNTAGYLEGTNVAWEMRLNRNSFNKTAFDGSAFATAILPYGFEFTVKGQMFRTKTNILEYNNNVVGSQAGSGMLDREFDDLRSHTFMQMLTWTHDYGKNHIDVLLDHENYNYESKYDFVRKTEQTIPDHLDLNNFAVMDYGTAGYTQIRTESYLGRARYNYDQKYYAEASIRRDGSSRFGKGYRWGTFWSVGASWMLSKEKFLQNVSWLSYLKLRADYGSVGNDQSAPAYAHYSLYDWSTYDGGAVTTLVPSFYGTQNLKWESTKTVDAAIEGALFDDRFTFSVGFFNKRNSDLLFKMTLPSSVGTIANGDQTGNNPTIWRNIATMDNTGWELQFGVDIIRNANLKWNFNIDATFLKNTIKKLPDGKDLPAQGLFKGKSIYEHVYFDWAGVDQLTGQSMYGIDPYSPDFMEYNDNGELSYNQNTFNSYLANARADAAAGKSVFIERDGKYYTSNTAYATKKICGTALPTVYGSFGTGLSWKGINLGVLFTYSLGGKTYDDNYQGLMSAGSVAGALHRDVLKSWTEAPAGMTADSPDRIDPKGVPQLCADYSQENNATSSRWLTSSNYLCLKNVNLSYDFPKSWAHAMAMQNLNLGVTVDNVFVAAKRKGMNPQYGFKGGQGRFYVPSRTVSFQLTARF